MSPVLLFIVGSIAFLVLHRAVEGIVVSSGNVPRRKFLWDMGTAVFFVLAIAGLWVLSMFDLNWRLKYGTILLIASPFVVIGAAVFGYISYYVYTDGGNAGEVE